MVKNLLSLTERRLERIKQQQQMLRRSLQALQQQQQDIRTRIHVLETQSSLYDQAAELTREAFFERQRHKAALLAEIARQLYDQENLQAEQITLETKQRQMQRQLRETDNRCEKFRTYLKRERSRRRLNRELQQQYEIEELSTYGGDKTGSQ
ncbi:hypothetical protein AB8965_15285 [Yersinia enterocolitica]|uniref:hypothetical protein n=1 Tax=Yersinia enterocolitica TaxID=630 RepID=UPI001C8DA747|nr:hypothetical protein [Yersinia enterocolitica]MBX9498069.1 hypothetical protein [Yersinia enterocolitica]HDL7825974.1 hypothetical protein [Yersinia enterocolitica]HDL7833902.1 hypothetical protein [Yersinia enterocolitica]HDL7874102.1 hypothetical protein [Yersinia enterocolitica]HDL7887327.1 hypothetical protein [Yersinia enterocolitica]